MPQIVQNPKITKKQVYINNTHNNSESRDSVSSKADSGVKIGPQRKTEIDLDHVKGSKFFRADFPKEKLPL